MWIWLLASALAGDALTFEAVKVVEHGKDVPRVIFHVGVRGRLRATTRCGSRSWDVDTTASAGSDVELRLDGIGPGTHDCRTELRFLQADGADGATGFDLQVASLPPLELSTSFEEVDTDASKAVIHASRPVAEARLTALGARGVQLDQVMADLSDPSAPTFDWDDQGQPSVKLVVEARDAHGLWAQLELFPWSYAIPHEDVVFATGEHAIVDTEVPKLERAWGEVTETLALYGSVVEMNLYVAGYTDTVGDAASNQALSERRARSIARWFRDRGFSGTIHYQGFGESVLAVGTANEVDEARNRRAIYVLAAQAPPPSDELPKRSWRTL